MLSPLEILKKPYSVILLNQNGAVENVEEFRPIWNNAQVRISVDGGTNSWYALKNSRDCDEQQVKLPHYVSGDFDSIQPEILEYMRGLKEVKIVHTPDQDETDFTKAFQILCSDEVKCSPQTVITIVSNKTGRFDHQISILNTLIKSLTSKKELYLYDFKNLIFALRPNELKRVVLKPKLTCGVIPIDGPTKMTTQGLKWDLDGSTYHFGGIVSTSNETTGEAVTVQGDRFVLFTVEVSLLS